jgi:hypothetical protein
MSINLLPHPLKLAWQHIGKYLPTPYRKSVLECFATGLALFFVLCIYKAYDIQQGISYSGDGLFVRSVIFSLATFVALFINELISTGWVGMRRTRTWKAIWFTWEIVSGASITFLLFNYFWNETEWFWNGYFLLIFEYTCIMVFSIWLVEWFEQGKLETAEKMMCFYAENEKHKFSLLPRKLFISQIGRQSHSGFLHK